MVIALPVVGDNPMIADKSSEPEPLPEPDPSHNPLAHISASSMKSYFSCSLKYYFAKVLQIPQPNSPSLHLGKAVHEGLRYFNKARWLGEDTSKDAVIANYHTAWNVLESEEAVQYKDDSQRPKLLEQGENILVEYLDAESSQNQSKPLGVEVKLEAWDHPHDSPLIGIVDLVKQGNIPVDYKTIAATPSDLDLEAFQHELQLIAYQILLEENTQEDVQGLELVFLVKTKKPKVITHTMPPATEHQKERFWSMVEAYMDGVYHDRFYPQPGMHCNWCSYRTQCSQWSSYQ